MKIAFIDFVLDPSKPGASGLSDIVWDMARELAKVGDDVHVIGPYSVDPAPVPGITVHKFSLPPIAYRNIVGHILIVLKAWRVARSIPNLDVIHAPEYLTTGILAPFSRVPVVLTTPGNIYERIAHGNPFDMITTQIFKVAARSSARYCLFVDAISEDLAWWWRKTGTPPERVKVVPHGVDTERFQPISDARDRLGLPSDQQVVLYAGRLSPEKNVDVVILTVAELAADHPRLRLHIVGDGPQRAKLETLVCEHRVEHAVTFQGPIPRDDMPNWYSAADVVVLASSSEGLPRVLLEAMSCEAPFVGSRISGIVDVLRNGQNGVLVEARDQRDLFRALTALLADQDWSRKLGQQAANDVRSAFCWESVVGRFRHELDCALSIRTNGRYREAADVKG